MNRKKYRYIDKKEVVGKIVESVSWTAVDVCINFTGGSFLHVDARNVYAVHLLAEIVPPCSKPEECMCG